MIFEWAACGQSLSCADDWRCCFRYGFAERSGAGVTDDEAKKENNQKVNGLVFRLYCQEQKSLQAPDIMTPIGKQKRSRQGGCHG